MKHFGVDETILQDSKVVLDMLQNRKFQHSGSEMNNIPVSPMRRFTD
jgi:hypothetical protein